MEKIVWIGKYQEDIFDLDIYGSITLYGEKKENHYVYDLEEDIPLLDFVVDKIKCFEKLDNNIKYYFYDQNLYYMLQEKIINEKIICVNNEITLKWLNNKSLVRLWFRNHIKTPPSIVLSNKELDLKYLKKIFWGFHKFISQKMISEGGNGTFLLEDNKEIELDDDLYLISPYYENSISINITFIIREDDSIVFPPSIQIINVVDNRLLYSGSDFITAQLLPSSILKEIKKTTKLIIDKLTFLKYIGICGADFLVYDEELYFLELNPRFQGSSFLINEVLKNMHTSIYKLNFDAFYGGPNLTLSNKISIMDIDYSFLKFDNDRVVHTKKLTHFKETFNSTEYYDFFADKYYLMLNDWEDNINKQGKILKRLFAKYSKIDTKNILDCTCGIGIQSISLASENFNVIGSDISMNELNFAQKEAKKRNLNIKFQYADCRYLEESIPENFDAIISIDSALPHLMNRENFILAFNSIYNKLNLGGVFLSSYRDYAALLKTKPKLAYPIRFKSEGNIDYTIFRKWEWDNDIINSKQYVIVDYPSESKLYTNGYKQWAITKKELIYIALVTKYREVYWLLPEESGFTQPILCLVK